MSHGPTEVESRLAAARDAAQASAALSPGERTASYPEVARALRGASAELAELAAREMGKPVRQGRAEVEKCAGAFELLHEHAARLLADEELRVDGLRVRVTHRPLGVVLSILPWNFPLWQIVRAAAPAIAAGNAVLVKPAPGTPGSALALERLARDAGVPGGLLSMICCSDEAALALIDDPRIAAVTLTGSPRAGRVVGARAGAALKRSVLELGGSDPYVVLGDADVELAATCAVAARALNSGQTCVAAKRFLVVEPLRSAFEDAVVQRMAALVVGDPLEERTDVGPLARLDLRDALRDQVDRSVALGARVLFAGQAPGARGAFFPPMVLTDVAPGMPAFDEELFGPVAAIVPARDDDEALRLAGATRYGLGAVVFTRDVARGERIAAEALEAGVTGVNLAVRSHPLVPFGGIRESGYGRELGSSGIRELTNVKAIWLPG